MKIKFMTHINFNNKINNKIIHKNKNIMTHNKREPRIFSSIFSYDTRYISTSTRTS